ncbi:MAG: hypothetical protein ACRBBW_14425 [Cellvibrionaceae bacterium]
MIRQHAKSRKLLTKCSILLLMLCHSSSHAGLIAFDLYNNKSLNLIEYNNPLEGAFSHSIDDTFEKHRQGAGNISEGLIDDSKDRSDSLGLIEKDQDFDEFFAVQDLDNAINPSGQATASWIFDIENSSNLSLSLDIAAMGDFELSDWFRWDYAIDDFDRQTLFELNTEQTKTQAYQMASGAILSLDDPLAIGNPVLGNPVLGDPLFSDRLLNNKFQSFSAPIFGEGFKLKLLFTAQQNGGGEVLAFRNLKIEGQSQLPASAAIPTPATAPLLLIGFCGLWLNRRKKRLGKSRNSRDNHYSSKG